MKQWLLEYVLLMLQTCFAYAANLLMLQTCYAANPVFTPTCLDLFSVPFH